MPSATRVAIRTAMRAAAVACLTDYATSASLRLQVYPGRPASINTPTAFVDAISETVNYDGLNQRVPRAEVLVLHGLFDSKEAVDQGDAFVDGFIDWMFDNVHAAGASTLVAVVATDDDPAYIPDWLRPEVTRTYYATRITLEGLALSG